MKKLSKVEAKKYLEELKRRRKIVWVNEREISSLFVAAAVAIGQIHGERMNLVLPVIKELPDGCLIDGVFYDPMHASFGIIVLHDLFPVVEQGIQPEFLTGTLNTKYVHAIVQGHQIIGNSVN